MIWAFLLISLFHCEASRLTNPENAGDRFTKGASCNQRQLLDVKCDFHPSFTRVVTRVTVSMRAFLPNMSAGTWPWRRAESWQYPILHIPDAFHEHLGCVVSSRLFMACGWLERGWPYLGFTASFLQPSHLQIRDEGERWCWRHAFFSADDVKSNRNHRENKGMFFQKLILIMVHIQ